jgi:hypothetical protein
MNESESSQHSTQTLVIRQHETPAHKRLGFHTTFGTEWFEFSSTKIKEYYYELAATIANQRYLNDISFSTVLDMSSLNIDELENQLVFGSNLCTVLDCKVKDEVRVEMLRRVCGAALKFPEYEVLRHQVNELMEADLVAANVTWIPEDSIYLKVCLDMTFLYAPAFC